MDGPTIAVLTHEGLPCAAQGCTAVLLLAREPGGWVTGEEIPWRLVPDAPDGVRDQVRSLILELGECRIVVGAEISGLVYHVFDRMGFDIFQADGVDDALLDAMLEDVSAARTERAGGADPLAPVPADDQGRWFLDLVRLQERHPEVSSKKALREFFQKHRGFYELTVVCTHIPPWLEESLPALRLVCRAEPLEAGGLRAVFTHGVCKEGVRTQ